MDLIFSANTAHIMSWGAVCGMFEGAGRVLREQGLLALYGPFSFRGRHVSESNERFSAALRAQHPDMGVRDMAALDAQARAANLEPHRQHAMPANNSIAIWRRHC